MLKSKISLTLLFLYYIRVLEEKNQIKFMHFFSHSRFFSPSISPSSSGIFLAGIFCSTSILLAFKVCFLSFYTCSSCIDEKSVDVSYLNLKKYSIVMNLCSFDMEYQRFEVIFKEMWKSKKVEKTEYIKHVYCLNFLGLVQLCLYFSNFFLDIRLPYENSWFQITSFRWV